MFRKQVNRLGILESFSLEGKKAIVTGVSKKDGLCLSMAQGLQEAGAKIVLMDISSAVAERAAEMGGEAAGIYYVLADLTDHESLQQGFDKAVEILDGLDIVINGAGIQYRCDAIDYPIEKWQKIVDIHLTATFVLAQMAARYMIPNGGGAILNIASMTSYFGSRRIPAYTASKGGVMQLTKALSNEWSAQGVRVNAIAPGYMLTDQWADSIHTEQAKQHTLRIPMGRWGVGDDLKGVTVFLVSEAAAYITGAIVPVDGGYLGL